MSGALDVSTSTIGPPASVPPPGAGSCMPAYAAPPAAYAPSRAGEAPSSCAPVRSVYDRYARPATVLDAVSIAIRTGVGGVGGPRAPGWMDRVAEASR